MRPVMNWKMGWRACRAGRGLAPMEMAIVGVAATTPWCLFSLFLCEGGADEKAFALPPPALTSLAPTTVQVSYAKKYAPTKKIHKHIITPAPRSSR